MKTTMIDLGHCLGRISLVTVDGEPGQTPSLLISDPESEKSVEIWNLEALHNLKDALSEALDEYDSEQGA